MTEALNSDREIEKIILAKGAEGSIKKIEGKAKAKKIPLYYSDKSRMDRDADGGNHQGVIAVVSDYEYATVDSAGRAGGSPQSGSYHADGRMCWSAWRDHSETTVGFHYGDGCENIRRCCGIYAVCPRDQYGKDH